MMMMMIGRMMLTMMMMVKAAGFSETLVRFPTTQFHIPDDIKLYRLNKVANRVLKSVLWPRRDEVTG
jgi:hypothetical protein